MPKNKSENPFLNIVRAQKAGHAVGAYSVCSANRFVLDAAMRQALADGAFACIESTSNQVDQFGGYTGMTPVKFVAYVKGIARAVNMPAGRFLLGGDHIGPNAWKNESAVSAMSKARDLVREYVEAGYSKIHFDASMRCADDPPGDGGPMPHEVVADRAADLCRVAEDAWKNKRPGSPPPVYVIGTEVPPPGGAAGDAEGMRISKPTDVAQTIETAKAAFVSRGLESAWERVFAVVVQPGVEFGDDSVFVYDRKKAAGLSRYIRTHANFIYEAHSTDYQSADALRNLVQDHFAVLKVGPWLTFALREALLALELIEKETLWRKRGVKLSAFRDSLERAMLRRPAHWKKYYHGDAERQKFCRMFSQSDRCRYYLPMPEVSNSISRLLANLDHKEISLALISQYLPGQCPAVRSGEIGNNPRSLIRHKIMEVTSMYALACGIGGKNA
ncbi:MAG: class II D-tagatose-bisphosphate aldolase, non-catalytic subunit [Planctomycetes bacterium]|nr:class II D-tagatose-bisphosphate aldolase, non-catalytic subunit [Planctomycetota bacterium]